MSANRFVPVEDRITKVIRESQRPGEEPWEKRWNGKSWEDMPTCGGYEMKLLDFALFRRGMYDPEFDLLVEEEDDGEPSLPEAAEGKVARRTMNQRKYATMGGRGRMALAAAMREQARTREEKRLREADLEARAAEWARLKARYEAAMALKQRGLVRALYDLDPSAHSALSRALGRGRGNAGVSRWPALTRLEGAFNQLREKGWTI